MPQVQPLGLVSAAEPQKPKVELLLSLPVMTVLMWRNVLSVISPDLSNTWLACLLAVVRIQC